MSEFQDTAPHREKILKSRPIYKKSWMGLAHLSFEYIVGFTVIILCLNKISAFTWELAVYIPGSLTFGSFCVYMIHRFPFHKQFKFSKIMYREHTLIHHYFYSKDDYEITSPRELNRILFDLLAMVVFVGGISLPISAVFYYYVSADLAYYNMLISVVYFLLYETFHLIAHLPSSWWITRVPYISYMRNHHHLHHDWRLMHKKNFNVVLPIFDFLLGTHQKNQKNQKNK